jgi:hypothetical protein
MKRKKRKTLCWREIMRVSDVRKKYPEFFVMVESAVWENIKDAGLNNFRPVAAKRIAYNVAAVATLELHKIMVKK